MLCVLSAPKSSPASFRVLYAGRPFGMLKPEHYEQLREIEITFDAGR